jgi:uncharacterized protein (TIGR00730 family)
MRQFSHLCVFCGASDGARPEYRLAAELLGGEIARRGVVLVYGGGSMGLMGGVAEGALRAGGRVIGVITKLLHSREVAHKGLTELHVVDTMHERKRMMADLAQGFIVLPGGFGTFDELFEIIAWAQLGIHRKPIGLLNTADYYNGLLTFLDHSAAEGFLRLSHRDQIVSGVEAGDLIGRMRRAAEW